MSHGEDFHLLAEFFRFSTAWLAQKRQAANIS
jgi:hypothetical protein